MEHHQEEKTFRDTFLRLVALLGVVLVLLLGAWGIILLAFNLSSIVAGAGSSITSLIAGAGANDADKGESLSVTAPSSPIASGAPFTVSWNHANKDGEYSYALSFSCATGLSVQAPTPAGKSQIVACEAPFNYVGAMSSMTLTAKNVGKQAANTTITVTATRLSDGAITASASTDIIVSGAVASAPATPSTPSAGTGATYIPATRVSNLYGYADLATRILAVTPSAASYGRTVVQFEVVNQGTNMAPAGWNLEAELPIDSSYRYSSPAQQALYPGDKILYTLTFDADIYDRNSRDDRYDDERYDECDRSHNSWDEEDWMDWYQDTWDTSSHSRDDWDTSDWEDWYDDFCDDYDRDSSDRYDSRSTNGTLTVTADPRNYVRELNENNNTVSVRVPAY
jgi:hypothetical protein